MKKRYLLLFILAGCDQNNAGNQPNSTLITHKPVIIRPAPLTEPVIVYASGDRDMNGPDDTLHVSNGLVLYLRPGSKSDFAESPRSQTPYSEARVIRQEGDGQVYRAGHTLVLTPFHQTALCFSDNTSQIRGDENEDAGIQYRFSGSVIGRPYWIVDSLMYEYYHPFLINKYSGRTTPLWDIPEISPNRQRIVVATPGLDSESSLNGLQLFAISNQSVSLLWTKALVNWQPQKTRWLTNNMLAVEQLRFTPKEHTTYIRLIFPN